MNVSLTLPRPTLGRRWDGALTGALVGARLRERRNRFRTDLDRRRGRVVLTGVIVAPMMSAIGAVIFVGLLAGFRGAGSDEQAATMLGALLTLMALGAFVGSSTTALQSLYLATDLPFLTALPIPLRVLFAGKLIESAAGALPAGFIGALSLAAFGVDRAGSILILPVAIVIWVTTIASSTAFSVVVVAVVTQSIPAKRARLFLFAMTIGIVAVTMLAWRIVATPTGDQLNSRSTIDSLGDVLAWLPTGWAAQLALAAGRGDRLQLGLQGVLVLMAALEMVVFAYAVFARTFTRGLASARATPTPVASKRWASLGNWLTAPLPTALGAFVLKEWLTIFRDLRRLSGAVWPLGVVAVYGVTSARGAGGADGDAYSVWMSHASLALVPWAVSLGVSIYAVGAEQRNVQLLRLLPLSPRAIFLGKALAAIVPIGLFSVVLTTVVLLARGTGPLDLLAFLLLIVWTTVGFVVVDTAAAAVAPNFTAGHVQRSTDMIGRAFGIVAGSAFGLCSAIAVARLVFAVKGAPALIEPAFDVSLLGIAPLGVPLVVGALAAAVGVLLLTMRFAESRLAVLIEQGP